jgi:hypothetical protein
LQNSADPAPAQEDGFDVDQNAMQLSYWFAVGNNICHVQLSSGKNEPGFVNYMLDVSV